MKSIRIHRTFAAFLAAGALAAGGAEAGGGAKKDPAASGPAYLDLAATALPIMVGGRVKNYVFVQMRLTPGPGADLAKLREKEPYYRDALVRAAHRTPFTKAGDLTVVDKARLEAVTLAEARRIAGPKSFSRAELMKQTARRRTGIQNGAAH